MSVETLRTVNGIGPRAQVPPEHALLVPAQTPSADGAASLRTAVFTTVPSGRTFYYTVRRGDTLARVASRYGVSSQDLKRWTGLAQEHVKVGQQLRVTTDAAPVRTARHGRRGAASVRAHAGGKAAPARAAASPAHKASARPARTAGPASGSSKPGTSARRSGAPAVAHGGGAKGG